MLTLGEITSKLKKLDNWTLDGNSITKQIDFDSLKESASYIGKVAEISEKQGDSPDIIMTKGIIRLTLPSSMSKELSENDFSLAEEIDKIQK